MKRIAIIPARSGSKGLKDKNIIDLCGKPLIAYSIEAALETGLFDHVIVSTDSEHYAEIAQHYGVSRSQGVVRYILDTYGDEYDIKTNPNNPCLTPNIHVVLMLKRAFRHI